jgi:hypothetical protein
VAKLLKRKITFCAFERNSYRKFGILILKKYVGHWCTEQEFFKNKYLFSFPDDGFVDGLLTSASRRISSDEDEAIILSALDRLEANSQVKTTTRATVVKNIKFNKDYAASQASNTLSVYIHNYLKAHEEGFDLDFEELLRLPKTSRPIHYEVHLDVRNIDRGSLPYTGHVSIDVEILETTDRILLHSKDQVINQMRIVRRGSSEEIRVLDHRHSRVNNLAIYFVEHLVKGTLITITADYSTNLLDEIDGFYRDSYLTFDENNQAVTKYLATTQFQAVEARRVFPSYDEPEYRPVFDIIITHPGAFSAVSNMPDINVTDK